MKYIRTKDGIYEALEAFKTPEGHFCFSYEQKTNNALNPIVREGVYDYDLIKQADYIRELLDEIIDNKNLVNILPLENIDLTKDKIYGAIWTDKGLIYVAKLNEKGNWELL